METEKDNWKIQARESEAESLERAASRAVEEWGEDGQESARLYRERANYLRRGGPHSDSAYEHNYD
ncbi:hypothetical protein KA107_02910 [Candidatus Pacearchaeota archaeon]|nr:hypothetical protein [Candidatus Pacearchaeota archaeon]